MANDRIPIEEAFRRGIIKNGDKIDYNPLQVFYIANRKKTGFYKSQVFFTEDLDWRIAKNSLGFFAVPKEPTETKLSLYGLKGYYKGPATIHHIAKMCYVDRKLAKEVCSVTARSYSRFPNLLRYLNRNFWLTSRSELKEQFVGIKFVEACAIYSHLLYDFKTNTAFLGTAGVLPIAFLKDDLYLINAEEGDGKTIPWKFE